MSLINKAGQTDRQLAERILEFSPQTGGWAGDINTCQQVQKIKCHADNSYCSLKFAVEDLTLIWLELTHDSKNVT